MNGLYIAGVQLGFALFFAAWLYMFVARSIR